MQIYAVREIATYLRELFETNSFLGDIWISGEVSNESRPASGHVYFTLKDGQAQIRSVFFASKLGRPSTAHLVRNGDAVVAHGRVSYYEQRGDLQFYVDFVQPEGAGVLQSEYERLKAKLEAEGLFDESRKRPLPEYPRRIGVVTSESGAVFHDICHVLERRWPVAELVLAPTPVQGADAVAGIIGGLHQLNAAGDIDVIIAARGGGSVEELWAFNDEMVARAIFGSGLPVVSAVGHETDYTIADFVADRRAPTPSAAAEIVAPDRVAVLARIGVTAANIAAAVEDRLAGARSGTLRHTQTIERHPPDVASRRTMVSRAAGAISVAVDAKVQLAVHQRGTCVWRLKALDPFATLERGYAIVQRGAAVVSSVTQVKAGDALDVRVKDGTFGASVGSGVAAKRRRPRRSIPDEQAPLFTMPQEQG